MPDARSRPERPPAERLPLGQASRLLGVDPDTLRRWADEGRVPAFTTLGGHRRFERRALERLVATRRTGAIGALGGVGDSTDRLNAAYRRRYGEIHGDGPELRAIVPETERDAFRDTGRRLAEALVRYLDGAGPARNDAEAEAVDLAALLGKRVRRQGIPLAAGVSMFVACPRCSQQNYANATQCAYCGAPLGPSQVPAPHPAAPDGGIFDSIRHFGIPEWISARSLFPARPSTRRAG